MLAVIFIVLLLGLWVGASQVGEAGRSTRCQSNLAALGNALHSYAKDNNNALPAAGIDLDKTQTSWDGKLFAYLKPALAKSNGAYEQRMLQEAVAPYFLCPSDATAHRGTPRSYAMSAHDMQPENWPPGPGNATGIGLVWNQESLNRLLDDAQRRMAAANQDSLPAMKLAFIAAPAGTLALTELLSADNNLKGLARTVINGPVPQVELLLQNQPRIHGGYCNYLMLDGHVEQRSPLQAGTTSDGRNFWNINQAN
jgi:prepilin-type processing-associated H-X9-DG protein